MKAVGVPFVKKDAKALVTGKPVYTNDLAPKDCLIVKLLRSPHANAMIQEIKTDVAMRVPGIEAIYTWKDVPQQRFTIAGQTWPEPSPYDRLILDQHVRFVGDPVAIIAGERAVAQMRDAFRAVNHRQRASSDGILADEFHRFRQCRIAHIGFRKAAVADGDCRQALDFFGNGHRFGLACVGG